METPTELCRRAGDGEDSPASIKILVKSWGVALFLLIIFILCWKTILWLEVWIVILSFPHHPFWGGHADSWAVTLTTIQAHLGKACLQWQGREMVWKPSSQLLFHLCWICRLLWTSQIIDLFENLYYVQLKGGTRTAISNWEVCRVLTDPGSPPKSHYYSLWPRILETLQYLCIVLGTFSPVKQILLLSVSSR